MLLILSIFLGLSIKANEFSFCVTADEQYRSILTKCSFKPSKVTYSSDIFLPKDEFYYLTQLHENKPINDKKIQQALFYLFAKKKFKNITITSTKEPDGYHVHITLCGLWTLEKIKIHGLVLLGKDRFRQHYLLEPGEVFDKKKHEMSLQKIADSLHEIGYFQATVSARIEKQKESKSIIVHLYISKGKRFAIHSVDLKIDSEQCFTDELEIKKILEKKYFKVLRGSKYGKDKINQITKDIKHYLQKEGFFETAIILYEQVDLQNHAIDLNFVIQLPDKHQFYFYGNSLFSGQELLQNLLLFGQSIHFLPADLLAQEIMHLYKEKGYWQAQVLVNQQESCHCFYITEGPRAHIEQIEITGVNEFDVKKVINKACASVVKQHYVDEATINQLFNALAIHYTQHGYWDFSILQYDFEPLDTYGAYLLHLSIDEGSQSIIKEIEVQSDFDYPEMSIFQEYCGLAFVEGVLQQQQQRIIGCLEKNSIKNFELQPTVQKEEAAISIVWTVKEKKPLIVGKTVMVGPSLHAHQMLLKELEINEGEIKDPKKLKNSFLKLKELNLFEHIQIQLSKQTAPDGKKPLLLKLQKDDPYEIRFRAGAELQQLAERFDLAHLSYKLGGTFIFKNPFFFGDHFKLETDFTRAYHNVVASYSRPWLFGKPIRTLFQVYDNKYQYPGIFDDKRNLYQVTQQGFLVGFNRKWIYLDSGANIGVEWMETTISKQLPQNPVFIEQVTRAINFQPRLLDKKIPFFVFEPTMLVDLLDNNLDPHYGILSLATLKGMLPLGGLLSIKSYFLRLMAEQSFFIPFKKLTFAFRIRFGHIFHECFSSIMPSERFYLGGANSIRSYQTDMAPPLGEICNKNGERDFVPKGGKSMVNVNIELRIPVYKQFGFALFQDLGTLSDADEIRALRETELLAGSGFGLRYNTPLGPLRFDIAWKWRVFDPCIMRYAWFLSFGQAF